LGDLVAGTLVVYQRHSEVSQKLPSFSSAESTPLSVIQLGAIPAEVLEACDEFLRMAHELAPKHRQELAESLVELIEKTSGVAPGLTQSSEAFLAAIIRQSSQIPQAE
jgi:hypothetical protein